MFDIGQVLEQDLLIEKGFNKNALVSTTAKIGNGVEIGANAQIGPDVEIDDNVKIAGGAVISGKTRIGEGTQIHSFATVGTTPQDKKYSNEPTKLIIGKNNVIREYVNISIGTETGLGVTTIGDGNLFMAFCHIAHDCIIGNNCILANGVHLAGHVTVEDSVVFGGMSGAHQFCHFGEFAMIGAGSIVVLNVAPYLRVQGDRSTVRGINTIGITRGGFSSDDLKQIKEMYRLLFSKNLTLELSIQSIESNIADCLPKDRMLNFLKNSLPATNRGLCR